MTTTERNKRTRDECPVCMECIGDEACEGGGTDGDRVVFPCGHLVCASCNAGMLLRDDHRCPTCRTPRGGFTREMADASAEQRLIQDMAEEGNTGAARLMAMRSMLLNDSHVTPVAANDISPMLQELIAGITQARGRPLNRTVVFVGSNGNRVHVQQRTAVGPRRSDRVRDRLQQQQSEMSAALYGADEQEPAAESAAESAADLEARMPQPLRDLISALVSPADLASFHEVRRRV